jgi:hypothetical protein
MRRANTFCVPHSPTYLIAEKMRTKCVSLLRAHIAMRNGAAAGTPLLFIKTRYVR